MAAVGQSGELQMAGVRQSGELQMAGVGQCGELQMAGVGQNRNTDRVLIKWRVANGR
jgi:hypothetical protein